MWIKVSKLYVKFCCDALRMQAIIIFLWYYFSGNFLNNAISAFIQLNVIHTYHFQYFFMCSALHKRVSQIVSI